MYFLMEDQMELKENKRGTSSEVWNCAICTYLNTASSYTCEMCTGERIQQNAIPSTPLEKLSTHPISNPIEDIDHAKTPTSPDNIFQCNGIVDVISFIIVSVIGILSVFLIYLICGTNEISYCIAVSVYFAISGIMTVFLNNSGISTQKVFLTLIILYTLFGGCLILMAWARSITSISFATCLGVTSFISSLIIILVLFCYEYMSNKRRSMTEIVKYVWKIKALIIPAIAHIADTSSDIATSYEYYQRAQSTENESGIAYKAIFVISIFILCLYRILSGLIIYQYTQSTLNGWLQFLDMFVFKILRKEWTLKYQKIGRFHQLLESLESIFESGPQAIISLYIIIADKGSWVIWISSFISITMIATKSISMDKRYFIKRAKECGCTLNWRYLVRVLWRIIDVTGYIILCAVFWSQFEFGGVLLSFYIILQLFVVLVLMGCCTSKMGYAPLACFCVKIYSFGISGLLYFSVLLATSVTPWRGRAIKLWIFALSRAVINIGLASVMFDRARDSKTLIVLLLLSTSFIFWILFVAKEGCCNCCNCCDDKCCGENWVQDAEPVLNIASCDNMTDIESLMQQGIMIQQYIGDRNTWNKYPRPHELVKLTKRYNLNLNAAKSKNASYVNYFIAIAENNRLDSNISSNKVNNVVVYLKQFCSINDVLNGNTPIELAAQNHSNTLWTEAFIKHGGAYDRNKCLKNAKKNLTSGQNVLIHFFENIGQYVPMPIASNNNPGNNNYNINITLNVVQTCTCNQCGERFPLQQGNIAIDPNDGNWYCYTCWNRQYRQYQKI